MSRIIHTIPPVCDPESRILILGSFPSIKSRESGFFYGHPQNRFWRVLATLLEEPLPPTVEKKTALLHRHGIALWDVIASCEITGSSDSSIRNVTPNDVASLLRSTPIEKIFVNGKTAERLYIRYLEPRLGIRAAALPSTSPANAAWTLPRLVDAWKILLEA